jgi:hypothetical protein
MDTKTEIIELTDIPSINNGDLLNDESTIKEMEQSDIRSLSGTNTFSNPGSTLSVSTLTMTGNSNMLPQLQLSGVNDLEPKRIELEFLDVSENKLLSLDGLNAFAKSSLKYLEMKNCGLDTHSLAPLQEFIFLTTLLLDDNSIDNIDTLIEILQGRKIQLTRLSLAGNPIHLEDSIHNQLLKDLTSSPYKSR